MCSFVCVLKKKLFQHFAPTLLLLNFCSGEIKLWGTGGHKRGGVGGGDDGDGGGGLMGRGCSFKGNVQPGVKLQPIVLHIVPEAHSKNSNKKRNHPQT